MEYVRKPERNKVTTRLNSVSFYTTMCEEGERCMQLHFRIQSLHPLREGLGLSDTRRSLTTEWIEDAAIRAICFIPIPDPVVARWLGNAPDIPTCRNLFVATTMTTTTMRTMVTKKLPSLPPPLSPFLPSLSYPYSLRPRSSPRVKSPRQIKSV